MLRRAIRIKSGTEDDNADSGAETAESDCSKMSSTSNDLMSVPVREPLREPAHRDYSRSHLCPVAGCPSLAVTLFLHEAYGEERILRVLDFLQRPPWQYHHTESCGGRAGGIHITSTTSPSNALLRPYLLPSRDFYSLGKGMPVWGVRPVHCGGEMLRVTLYSGYDNFEDAVRLYETILQRQAEEQKTGFCWFTLHTERGLCLQLAIKQLSPGVRVEPCDSAVLQFRAEEIGQLVPLLPNPCTPISATRWQTEDLDGNKILFQVKGQSQLQLSTTSAFSLNCSHTPSTPLKRTGAPSLIQAVSPCSRKLHLKDRGLGGTVGERGSESYPAGLKCWVSGGCPREESMGSDSCCSTPLSSSCYSSQRSSPATLSVHPNEACSRPPSLIDPSLSCFLAEEPETNVDTGFAVVSQPERPAAVGASALDSFAEDLCRSLPDASRGLRTRGTPLAYSRDVALASSVCTSRTLRNSAQSPRAGLCTDLALQRESVEQKPATDYLSHTPTQGGQHTVQQDEFFI
ncbi:hypothetical protein MATL_G00120590 [Megalops atlanticus]|uniref:FAM124 domain-containing protein n=1 Tax=Megalops atlanticus TaxID=7932 RepID=A0A9D3Q0U0_MEGAT|nr:hypothetical protein MATL_G00120590 [Megalops atlanticus]